jgi:peroxiredoxin (alkyl hydroperoxide reductase subunit C)
MSLVGKKAPIFNAPAVVDGEEIIEKFSLEQYIGKKEVMFFFYPKDFTFVCPTEIHAFQEKLAEFEKRGVAVVGASCDSEETHLAWLMTPKDNGGIEGVTYPLVADLSKTIASNYGVLAGDWVYDEDGNLEFEGQPVAFRGTFFIDKEGIVRHETINDLPLGRNIDEMLRIVDAWHHVEKFGEVCPANWEEGKDAMKADRDGVSEYLSKN